MQSKTWVLAAMALAFLAACGAGSPAEGPVSPDGEAVVSGAPRASTVVRLDGRGGDIGETIAGPARYAVDRLDVDVPDTLVVSEANLFYPKADIVWRAEPIGDRYAQVKSVLAEGFGAGVAGMTSGPRAVVSLRLERFHSLTEKARYSVGGVHDVVVLLTVRDAASQAILEGPRRIEIAIRASGGDKAIAEDVAGNTQRMVIVAGLAEAIRRELALVPVGIEAKRKGLFAGLSPGVGTQ